VFAILLISWLLVTKVSLANLSYGDSIQMDLVWWDGGARFSPMDANTAEYFTEESYAAYALKTAKNYIWMGDLIINTDNSVQGKFLWWLWIHSTEYERILADWNIVWNLSMDGIMSLQISGKSREFQIYQKTYWEWKNWLCSTYEKKWPVTVDWNFDKNSWIITMTLTNCDGAKYFFKSTEKIDLVSCEENEVYIDEKCKPISDFCSDDKLVSYDASKEKCYCPIGYKLTDKKACEKVEEMVYEINYPEQRPPFLMDGKEYKIKLSIKNGETWEPMAATKIAIKYTSAPKQWEIINIKEEVLWKYTLTYKPAIVETWNMNWRIDGLYIFYNSKLEWKEVYKTYEIPLWTWIPIKISKNGFQKAMNTIVFSDEIAQIKVVTQNKAGEKVPVYDADVVLDGEIVWEKTDKKGLTTIKSPEEISIETPSEIIEVVLVPNEEIIERQSKALKQYKQIIQWEDPLTSPELRLFVEDFSSYLAQLDDDKIENAIIWLKRVAYTLLYMTEWKNLIKDISDNVANSLKNQVTDTLDLIWANEKMSKYLWWKVSQNVDMKKLQDLAPNINNEIDSLCAILEEKTINTIKLWIQKYAPTFKSKRSNDLLWVVFGKYWRDDMIQKWIDEMQKVPVEKIEKIIKNYLMDEFDVMLMKKMKELENTIKDKNFSSSEFVEDISISKLESLSLRDKYMTAHEVSYDITMIKNYADLTNNIVGETMKITQVYKKQAEIAEKWYKAIRSLFLDTTEIYYRVDAYGKFVSEVESNVDRGIGIAGVFDSNKNTQQNIFSSAYAVEIELTDEQKNQAYNYRGTEAILDIVGKLEEINKLFLIVYPDNEDLQKIAQNLAQTRSSEQNILDELWAQAKNNISILLDNAETDNEGISDTMLWLIIVLTPLFLIFWFVLGKKRKKNKIKK